MSKNEKNAKELRAYFADTDADEKRMLTLVSMCLRNFALEIAHWGRNEEQTNIGLFDVVDSYEEAERILEKLRMFGYLPERKP